MFIDNKRIYKQVADELNISPELVERVVKNKFKFIREQMIKADNIAIFDEFWGTYYLSEKAIYSAIIAKPEEASSFLIKKLTEIENYGRKNENSEG